VENSVTAWLLRIWRSFLALPLWVIIWICLFLVPVNFIGFWFLDSVSGRWIAFLGAGGILLNAIPVLVNGGFSKVLCVPHLLCWIPLVAILGYRLVFADLVGTELQLAVAAFVINGASLFFDVYDFFEWRGGKRDVAGFPDEAVKW
jgi:hypothetical protein